MEDVRRVTRAWDLPTLPHVASRILAEVRSPETTAGDLADLVARDQALASKVLRMANSTLFGLREPVASLQRAVVIMGFTSLRSMVMTATMRALCSGDDRPRTDELLWEHSLGTAMAARLLAGTVAPQTVEEAYVAGLMHDIGKLVMRRNLGEEYQGVVDRVLEGETTFREAEREAFGFDHTQVGSVVVKKWRLPDSLEEAVRLHHDPAASQDGQSLCALTSLANAVCVQREIGAEHRPDLVPAETEAARILCVPAERLERVAAELVEKFEAEKELFGEC